MLRVADAQKITGFLRLPVFPPICPRAPKGLVRLPRPYLVAGRFATQNAEQAETRDQTPRGQILATSHGATSPHAAPRAGRQEWMIVRGASARPFTLTSRRVEPTHRIARRAGNRRPQKKHKRTRRAIARYRSASGAGQQSPGRAGRLRLAREHGASAELGV